MKPRIVNSLSTSICCLFLCLASTTQLKAQDLSSYPVSLTPLDAINSDDNDYAPCLTPGRDQLYFTSTRSKGKGSADLYVTARVQKIQTSSGTRSDMRPSSGDANAITQAPTWEGPSNMQNFNTDEFEGAFSLAGDGRTIVFAAQRDDSYGDIDIYSAELIEGVLHNVKNVGATVNSEYWESQPSISRDGKTLYFSSNRPGGVGATDIWVSTRNADGSWSAARCLDRTINTEKDERSPFITADGGTLVFASNGHAGFGGYDLFYSSHSMNGDTPEWSAPTNLGGVINSDHDELFFCSAAVGDYFYISSDRNVDRGLDIYQGTPNLVGLGTTRLVISVVDSLSNKAIPASLTIIDAASGLPVTTLELRGDDRDNVIALPANHSYRVECRVPGSPVRTQELTPGAANSVQNVRFMYGNISFDFSQYQIPFFVTGYYRPNTTPNLASLFDLRTKDLADANYIERFDRNSATHQRYKQYAETVDALFNRVVTTGVDTVFPRFRLHASPEEILEVTVIGYADPKPILGRYVESESIDYVDINGAKQMVEKGDRMTNQNLSGLRAVHSARELQKMFEDYSARQGRDDVRELLKSGRLRFRCVAGGVNTSGTDFAAQRRIKIDFTRIGGNTKNSEFDTNTIKK